MIGRKVTLRHAHSMTHVTGWIGRDDDGIYTLTTADGRVLRLVANIALIEAAVIS